MGWLKELLAQAPTQTRTWGALARETLRRDNWPAGESRMQERSLAALFTKLDRGQELEWLADRPGAQLAIAKALRAPVEEIRAQLVRTQDALPKHLIRLSSLPAARGLSLLDEPLYPGIPREVTDPAGYDRVLWFAPSGAGRTLTGQWLEARGLSHFIACRTWSEAIVRLPARGAAFVELTHERIAPPPPTSPNLRLCVAGAFRERGEGAWHFIDGPAPATYLSELVQWVERRLPSDGRFDARAVERWLLGEPLESGVLDSPGAALGLCGLADELGPRVLELPLRELVRRFVTKRFSSTLDPESAHAQFFKRHGYGALLALVRRLLSEQASPWDAPRSRSAWLELVPEELQREADLEWLKLSLAGETSGLRVQDLERAARKLPPGAFRVVRSFEQAELLQSDGKDELRLGPHFVARTLVVEAIDELIAGSPLEWGGALLSGSAGRELEARVLERARATSGASLEPLLESSHPEHAGYAAALELGLVAAGLALLDGRELSTELKEALFDDALELMIELPGELPAPRILRGGAREQRRQHALWLLCALAVSEELPARGARHSLLRPWNARQVEPRMPEVLDRILEVLPELGERRALAVFALVARLRAELGALVQLDQPHALERPSVVIDEVLHGVLTWASAAGLGERSLSVQATRAAAAAAGLDFGDVARAIWQAWDAAERPAAGADFLLPEADTEALFWSHIPRELLGPMLSDQRDKRLPFARLGAEQWAAIDEAVLQGELALTPELVRHAPVKLLDNWLLQVGLDAFERAGRESLFERIPEGLLRVIELHFEGPAPSEAELVARLLDAAPQSAMARIVELAGEHAVHRLPEPSLSSMRKLLHGAVAGASELRSAAYPVLFALEERLNRARRERRSYPAPPN
jgi:hypothetical protein